MNYMHELRREEHWFARQLNQEGTLQDVFLDCCAKKKEFDYTDPAIRSLKIALERGLSHRLRCEALNAHRICILAVRKGVPETERAVKMGGVKATLDYIVGLLEYWRSDDNKRFNDMLQAVTELADDFPQACMTVDCKAPYFPFAKGDVFDDEALKKELLIRLKDDKHPFGYKPASLLSFHEPADIGSEVEGLFCGPPIELCWFMSLSVLLDHWFCYQLMEDDYFCEIFKRLTLCCDQHYNPCESDEDEALKEVIEHAIVVRLRFEHRHVERILMFCAPSVTKSVCKTK